MHFNVIDVLLIEVQMLPLNVMKIVKKWQTFFEHYDGGGRHLELLVFRLIDVADVFQFKVATYQLTLVIVKWPNN